MEKDKRFAKNMYKIVGNREKEKEHGHQIEGVGDYTTTH